jgi:hypothetical protein
MQKLYRKNILFKFYGDDFVEILPFEFLNLERGVEILNKEAGCNAYHYGGLFEYLKKIQEYFTKNEVETR